MSAEFLVHERRVTFITVDRLGDMRMLDFDPTGGCLYRLG